MVAVRQFHLKPIDESTIKEWVNNLSLPHNQSAKEFLVAWKYCDQRCSEHPQRHVLFSSSIEMTEMLISLNMDEETLLAGLLFPFISAEIITSEDVIQTFGASVNRLIQGVFEMDAIRHLQATQATQVKPDKVDNIRRMLLAMVEDFRCVIIKLAERITFLRGAINSSEEERVLAAKECFNIYCPLANRLGIGQLKWELEDLCFRYLHPCDYRDIASLIDERRMDREKYIDDFVTQLAEELQQQTIHAEVYGRPKHIYSIWRKMRKKTILFEELYDLRAVRIVVERLQDCYATLGIIHTHYHHLPSEFDDYVANPKPNGYQSIHTVVLGPQGRTIEIQIRTNQMHDVAELGVAAHWKYKEGAKTGYSAYDERIAWLRKLLSWQEEVVDSGEILDEVRSQVFDDRVYVFTPKGDVVDLPLRATPLDFAYHIHSDIGHRCVGAKVRGKIVPFTYQLKMGDQVEILTQKKPNPSRDWLNPNLGYVNSGRARAKINHWFRKQDRDKNQIAGKQLLEQEFQTAALSLKEHEKLLLQRYNLNSLDDLYVAVGSGDVRINQLMNYVHSKLKPPSAEEADKLALFELQQKGTQSNHPTSKQSGRIIVDGVGNLMHHIARCCHPIPGDEIIGFITQGRGISIHRGDCAQLTELKNHSPERLVEASWGDTEAGHYVIILRVVALDRSGLLRDITTIMANEKINLLNLSSRTETLQQRAIIDMTVEIHNQIILSRVVNKVSQTTGVLEVTRLQN